MSLMAVEGCIYAKDGCRGLSGFYLGFFVLGGSRS